VAVKRMRAQRDSQESVKSFLREVTGLSRSAEHPDCAPYVVQFIGACLSPFCVVTDLCEGGSLSYILHQRKVRFPIRRASEIALRIALGMRGLHSLKPPIMVGDLADVCCVGLCAYIYLSICMCVVCVCCFVVMMLRMCVYAAVCV
jgi:serine/threonine protein kinase